MPQGTHILQRGLAAEQQRNLLQFALAHRQLDIVVGQDKSLQINQILGERQTVAGRATEYTTGIVVAVVTGIAFVPIELKDIKKITTGLGNLNRPGTVGQLAQACRIGVERQDLHQNGQPFLGHRGRRRSLGQEGTDRLVLAVETGRHMHHPLVHSQNVQVTLVEHRIAADLDVVGTRGGISDDTVGLEHAHRLVVRERLVHACLQNLHRVGRRDGFRVARQFGTGNVLQRLAEHDAQVGQGRIAGVKSVRCRAIELLRDQSKILGTACLQHADDHAVFPAHTPHDLANRVEAAQLASDITLDILKNLPPFSRIKAQRTLGVIVRIDIRQRLAALLEEGVTDTVVPLDGIQHPNRRLRLDNPIRQTADDQLILLTLFYGGGSLWSQLQALSRKLQAVRAFTQSRGLRGQSDAHHSPGQHELLAA